ncbi:MAG: ABC transporter ATP-binding protein [Anaerolineae bacterium]
MNTLTKQEEPNNMLIHNTAKPETETVTLELRNLAKVFNSGGDEHLAVDHINLEVKQGEFITILGPSGCGKTTTLRLVAGFENATSGDILLDGQVINHIPANQRPMTMVFQSYALFPHMSVFENIAYGLRINKLSQQQIDEKIEIVVNLMNLVGLDDRMPHQLSGGQQQRVALARALVMEPRLLLFDEPLSNLDAKLRIHMRTEIRRLQQRLGITSLYVTHDQAEAMGLSDRIVVMNNGKIEQVGSPPEIYLKPASAFVADFIGRSNFIKCTVLEFGQDMVTLDFFGQTVNLPANGNTFKRGNTALIIIRPESVRLNGDDDAMLSILGSVKHSEYLGTYVEYEVELERGHFISITDWNPLSSLYMEGDGVRVYFPPEALYVLSE